MQDSSEESVGWCGQSPFSRCGQVEPVLTGLKEQLCLTVSSVRIIGVLLLNDVCVHPSCTEVTEGFFCELITALSKRMPIHLSKCVTHLIVLGLRIGSS